MRKRPVRMCPVCGVNEVSYRGRRIPRCKPCSNSARGMTLEQRLSENCVPGTDNTACWNYTGGLDKDGYGIITGDKTDERLADGRAKRQQFRVIRLIYEREHGPIAAHEHVRHKCDNRACWNPAHLEKGSAWQNIQDKVARNRQARGEQIRGKLTADAIRDIRRRIAAGERQESIASLYDISDGMVSHIATGRSWRHIS